MAGIDRQGLEDKGGSGKEPLVHDPDLARIHEWNHPQSDQQPQLGDLSLRAEPGDGPDRPLSLPPLLAQQRQERETGGLRAEYRDAFL